MYNFLNLNIILGCLYKKGKMKDYFDDYEPTEDELRDIEELIRQAEEEDTLQERKDLLRNRIFYEYPNFDSFEQWLKDNGIRW